MAWEHERQLIISNQVALVDGNTTVPGLFSLDARVNSIGMPVGFIWYRENCRGELELAYIWVHEDCRRIGLATRMFQRLLKHFTKPVTVITGQFNEMSLPWGIKNGFVEEDGYFIRRALN